MKVYWFNLLAGIFSILVVVFMPISSTSSYYFIHVLNLIFGPLNLLLFVAGWWLESQ